MTTCLPCRRLGRTALLFLVTLGLLAACSTGTADQSHADGSRGSAAQPAGAPVARSASPSGDLYVVRGDGTATTAAAGRDRFTITMIVTDPVLAFTDRPQRGADRLTAAQLTEQWPALFAGDPPNAALSARADDKDVDLAVELTDPRWDPTTSTLTVTARTIGTDRAIAPPATLVDASLFIDDAQQSIQLNLTNLSRIPLVIQSVTPDPSLWSFTDGNAPPEVDSTFGLTSPNGPGLSLGLADATPGADSGASIILTGDYDNQFKLQLSWDADGNPTATLTQLSGTDLPVVGEGPMTPGTPVTLINLTPQGPTAVYQVLFGQM